MVDGGSAMHGLAQGSRGDALDDLFAKRGSGRGSHARPHGDGSPSGRPRAQQLRPNDMRHQRRRANAKRLSKRRPDGVGTAQPMPTPLPIVDREGQSEDAAGDRRAGLHIEPHRIDVAGAGDVPRLLVGDRALLDQQLGIRRIRMARHLASADALAHQRRALVVLLLRHFQHLPAIAIRPVRIEGRAHRLRRGSVVLRLHANAIHQPIRAMQRVGLPHDRRVLAAQPVREVVRVLRRKAGAALGVVLGDLGLFQGGSGQRRRCALPDVAFLLVLALMVHRLDLRVALLWDTARAGSSSNAYANGALPATGSFHPATVRPQVAEVAVPVRGDDCPAIGNADDLGSFIGRQVDAAPLVSQHVFAADDVDLGATNVVDAPVAQGSLNGVRRNAPLTHAHQGMIRQNVPVARLRFHCRFLFEMAFLAKAQIVREGH